MKRNVILKTVSFCIAVLFAVICACPITAEDRDYPAVPISEHDAEKLAAFWHQPAYNGLNNGEAVYDHEWDPGVNYYGDPAANAGYDGTWHTELVSHDGLDDYLMLRFDYTVPFWVYFEDPLLGPVYGDGTEDVYPDLYGALDLEGTTLRTMYSPENGKTHITSVDLDNCSKLRTAYFNGQEYCTSISALGMYQLEKFSALNCAYEHIAFSPEGYEKDVTVNALGMGTVGAEFTYSDSAEANGVTVYAYPACGRFVGWYADGVLVSSDCEYVCTEGCELTAYFGGDANGDGALDVNDALLMLRISLGLAHIEGDTAALDVTGNGVLDANDALLLMRFLLGLS